jgi:hopene-associated glycosyltransferase HpnB
VLSKYVLWLAILVLMIWVYLVFLHARFWRPLELPHVSGEVRDRVAVIIPARNEADVIGECITELVMQDFAGELRIFLVDDSSTDGTAQRAREAAVRASVRSAAKGVVRQVEVITGSPLPSGWSGKVWAMHQGWQAVQHSGFTPDYVLLTDADIVHEPLSLTRLIAQARSGGYDLTSLMVRLHCESAAERLLIPAFVYFFFLLYPPRRILNPHSKVAGAAGGCVLLRPEALERIGGFESIRDTIIDDCSLAKRVKDAGGKLWLGVADETRSIRPYGGFTGIRDMIARTAFNQLRHSKALLAGCVLGMALTFLAPIAMIPARPSYALLAFALMIGSYRPLTRYYRVPFGYALTLPIAACFYLYATIVSAQRYYRGAGGQWKERVQDPSGL